MKKGFEQMIKRLPDVENNALNESEKEIQEIQNQKQAWVQWLKLSLERIKNNEIIEIHEPHLFQVTTHETGAFLAQSASGKNYTITLGDLYTDESWGIGYQLSTEVPKHIRKSYILEYARRKISQLLDKQILIEETQNQKHPKESFLALKERFEKAKNVLDLDRGHQAEVMIVNFLSKLSLNGFLEANIIPADIYEDVVDKLDFIIQFRDSNLGVDVEIKDRVGVQVTLKDTKDQVLKKHKIIADHFESGLIGDEKIDSIALLYLGEQYVRRAIGKWVHTKAPGGPEQYLEDDGKRDILHRLLDQFLGEARVTAICTELGIQTGKRPVKNWVDFV